MLTIVAGGLDDARVQALLQHHLSAGRAETAPGSAHALDLDGLTLPEIRFWSAWDGGALLGMGALKQLSAKLGEVKSMHTTTAQRRSGVGCAMLQHIITEARAMGLSQLSLETGSWAYFAPARALYARHGFVVCAPFEGYVEDPNSVFMTREL